MTNPPTRVALRQKPGPNRLAVTGIGNAMLDIITQDTRESYRGLGLVKGAMSLIEEDQLDAFYRAMGPTVEMSGGSVANSISGIANLGGTCGYIGKIADDEFGERFRHDLSSLGVELELAIAKPGEGATGRCHVFITPDAQRTMATYLGASNQLNADDIRGDLIARSEITYVEGYLFDLPPAMESIRKVVNFAHEHDSMVALSLSDMFCVTRHRRDFLDLVTSDVDVLLANETEILSLFQYDELEQSLRGARRDRGARGRHARAARRRRRDGERRRACARRRSGARRRSERRGRHVRLGLPLRARARGGPGRGGRARIDLRGRDHHASGCAPGVRSRRARHRSRDCCS